MFETGLLPDWKAEPEAKYRGLLEAAPDAMVVVNQYGEIVLLNLQAEKQFGYRRDELLYQKVTNIIPKGFAERLIADGTRTAAEALDQQIGTGIELTGLRKDGGEFPIEIMLSPLENSEGILVTAAIRDISLRKAAEEHLAHMESRYRGLLEAAPDAMVVVNRYGEIVLLNLQAEKQFGYRRHELLGQQVKNIIPNGFAERLIADGTRTAAEALGQQIGTGIELTGLRKDGGEFPIEIMLSPLESAEGTLVTAAIRDISLRKDMETQNAQLHAKLRHAEKIEAIGTLAGGVAHELNNLLQPIIMMTELVLTELPADGEQAKQLLRVVDAGGKAAEIVQRILAFGRVDEACYDALDAGSVVREAIAFIRTILPSSVTLHISDIEDIGNGGTIRGNKTQLTQILMNMASNARDAIAANVGTVWISLSRLEAGDKRPAVRIGAVHPGPYVVLTVRDTGAGMDEATMARIFEPFFTTKDVGKGTGLGLSITHGIITSHGGAMQVDSAPGRGTKFSIYLPIEETQPVLALAS